MRTHLPLGIAIVMALSGGARAQAAEPAPAPEPAMERLGETTLADQRAGFSWGGLDIRLGAEIRSYLGSDPVMQTNLSWTDVADRVQRTFSAALAPGGAADLRTGMLAGSGVTMKLGNGETVFANEGRTAFIQRTDGAIQNIIVNTASNVDLRQQVDAQIDIGGFAPFRADMLATRIGAALAGMSGLASIRGASN